MEILEQKRRIITIAIIAVALTGILIAAIVSAPLINRILSNASQAASNVADVKTENVRAILSLYQYLALQTSSRSEIARVLARHSAGQLSTADTKAFSEPRLQDAAKNIDNLAALIRFDAEGEELVRIGPIADILPSDIAIPEGIDIDTVQLTSGAGSLSLVSTSSPVTYNGEVVGTDVLLFTLTSLNHVFQTEDGTKICLLNSDRTKHITLNPETGSLETAPSDTCLADAENIKAGEYPEFFHSNTEDGTQVLAFLRPVDGCNWELYMHSNVSQVFGDVIRTVILSALAILLLSGLAALVVWRSLKPILHALVSQASQIARSSEELKLAYQVVEHTNEAIVISDPSFNIIKANPAFADAVGLSARSLRGKTLFEFLDTAQGELPLPKNIDRQLIAENAWQGDVWLKVRKGAPIPNLLTISPVRNNHGQIHQLIQTFSNISERVKAEKQMIRLAHFDRLTGLPNRAALDNHLDQAIHEARRGNGQFAVMFIDLDKFKPVNDTFGHQAGDELLLAVAQRLKHSIRNTDVVGRRGGDEFVIITAPINSEDKARHIAKKVLQVLNEPFHVQNHNIQISASIGVALFPDDGITAEDLLKKADTAMYEVKNSGRNDIAFT
ncbi:diguanylate cyclase domain-containing protein [Marinobacter sp.]|uniref:diguanylate cyclase domain-containing protein n=1 Tax=Marinobacter sp. TaxID=50741 RepID=UPI003561803E